MGRARTSRAIVQTGVRAFEMREFPLPDIGREDGLLQVDACGICGSDYEQFDGTLPVRLPVIPGHEPVGTIVAVGDEAARRWGVQEGDRVCVETMIPCGACRPCVTGRYTLCSGSRRMNAYGFLNVEVAPFLWGGYSEYLYLAPRSLVHKIDSSIAPEVATLFNPLGAGFRWAVEMPDLKVGNTVLILGPGQRGLASLIAAREAGAGTIIISGLAADERKLSLAKELGADVTVNVEADDLGATVREATGGRLADVAIDVTAYATGAVTDAIDLTRRGGVVVLAGTKGANPVPDFMSDKVVMKELTIKGALGVNWSSYEQAIRTIESSKYPLERMHTHTLPLEEAERAIRILAGDESGEDGVHIALVP